MAWSEPNIKESTENSNKNSQYENINKILQGLIQKCLMKKAEQRPTIEELVMMPEFQ